MNRPTHQPRKRFGQNFLTDQAIIQEIVDLINPETTEPLVEIGPGLGALTKPILELSKELNAIEIDRDVIKPLKKTCSTLGELHIHQQDVLSFDFKLLHAQNKKLRLFGNLPYNISTPLLFHLMDYLDIIQDMHFMVQKEVADRLTANPGGRSYGRLTIMLQYHCEMEQLLDIPPQAFHPPPKVHSSFIRLIPKPYSTPINNTDLFQKIVQQAFNHRRKTLGNCLKPFISKKQFEQINIDPSLRPEALSIDEYIKISNFLAKYITMSS